LSDLKDGSLPRGGFGALEELASGAGEVAEVHAVEFVAEVAPGVPGCGLGLADEEPGEPEQHDMGSDAAFEMVVDGL
jgi:hypothetical protein